MSEYDYYITADLDQYIGKWVGILNKKVVATGKNFKEVAERVDKEYTDQKVLLAHIPATIARI